MKALFITILIFYAAFAIYDRFETGKGRRVIFERSAPADAPASRVPRSAAPASAQDSSESPAPAPAVATMEGSGAFVPPQIEPLETLTKNWTVFPPSAFPRHVKLSKPVTLQLKSGTSVLPAGSHAVAVGAKGNVLLISLTEESPPYGQTFVHDTDLPAQVRASYERWKKGRVESALVAWKKRTGMATTAAVGLPQSVDPQGMPKRNREGGYDLLLASMKSGQVTDIKPNKIQRWSNPQTKMIDGQPTWTVSVFYETLAFCGPVDAEAQAQIRNGQIVRWIYPGSGEPVP